MASITGAVITAGVAGLIGVFGFRYNFTNRSAIDVDRNFYGVLRVEEHDVNDPAAHRFVLSHGRIVHGTQFQADERRRHPTSYYGLDSGVGVAWRHASRTRSGTKMGVIGLGAGTIAAFADEGDVLRFYEINPAVISFCNQHFTYLSDAKSRGVDTEVFVGDARLVMERQLFQEKSQNFDVLVVDAFTGDAIPIHLLTQQCFEIYWKHLKPDGVLAVHISNMYFDLGRVVRSLATRLGKQSHLITTGSEIANGTSQSGWVLVTTNRDLATALPTEESHSPWPNEVLKPIVWTDDFSSLYGVLR